MRQKKKRHRSRLFALWPIYSETEVYIDIVHCRCPHWKPLGGLSLVKLRSVYSNFLGIAFNASAG